MTKDHKPHTRHIVGDIKTRDPHTSWAVLDSKGHLLKSESHLPHFRQDPASTTKLWTLYTLATMIEKDQLPDNFIKKHRHDINLMLVRSDNVASERLAIAAAGSEDNFCRIMTRLAHKKGLDDTQFKTCNGLPERGHYSTADDMARMAYLLERDFPQHKRLASQIHAPGIPKPNTGAGLLNDCIEFGKTGTAHGLYGAHGKKSYTGGLDHGGYAAVAGAHDKHDRDKIMLAADRFFKEHPTHSSQHPSSKNHEGHGKKLAAKHAEDHDGPPPKHHGHKKEHGHRSHSHH